MADPGVRDADPGVRHQPIQVSAMGRKPQLTLLTLLGATPFAHAARVPVTIDTERDG